MREGVINRKTNETDIRLKLELDGSGKSCIDTGCGFLDHMLTLFARHGRFDLTVSCKGDTEVDYHHTTEDIGIALGDAFAAALGDLRGVTRYGSFLLPMDEALIQTAVDLSGRAHLSYALLIPTQKVGDFDTELTKECAMPGSRYTSGSWRAKTPTISSRARSSQSPEVWRRRSRSTRPIRMRYHQPKGCCK